MQSVRQGVPLGIRRLCIGILACAVMLLAGCGSAEPVKPKTHTQDSPATTTREPGTGKPPFTLGTKNFTEEFILGQLYAQALRAKGYSIILKNDVGPSEVMDQKLTSGAIDGYPEYTGTILTVFGHNPKRPASALEAYQLAAGVEGSHRAQLLAMAPATDTDVIVSTPAYARAHALKSLADLRRLGSTATLAGPPEFRTRFSGLVGLRQEYGVTSIRFLPEPIGQQYTALASGRAQLAVGFTTDGSLTRGGYAMLSDPKGIFGFQNVTFVVRDGVMSQEGPEFAQTINAVSSRLSTEALRLMNAAVSLDQQSPAAVARQFLGANGLL